MKDCIEIRQAAQDEMDGPISAERRQSLEAHVRTCAECRDYRDGLQVVQEALRALPPVPFPEEALASIWSQTVQGAEEAALRRRLSRLDWRLATAAAAAVIVATLLLVPALLRSRSGGYSSADLARAEDDARQVLALTGRALHETRRAVDQVLAAEVSPAVRKIPIRWSQPKRPDSRRPRT